MDPRWSFGIAARWRLWLYSLPPKPEDAELGCPPASKKLASPSGETMYQGMLIRDLLSTAERVLRDCGAQATRAQRRESGCDGSERAKSESKEFPQPLGLSAADRNLGLLFVIHAELVRTLKPGNHLANAVDVDQVGAVGAPEEIAVKTVEQLLECPAVGLSFHPRCTRSHNCDDAVFDPCITDIFLVHEKHAPQRLQQNL